MTVRANTCGNAVACAGLLMKRSEFQIEIPEGPPLEVIGR